MLSTTNNTIYYNINTILGYAHYFTYGCAYVCAYVCMYVCCA